MSPSRERGKGVRDKYTHPLEMSKVSHLEGRSSPSPPLLRPLEFLVMETMMKFQQSKELFLTPMWEKIRVLFYSTKTQIKNPPVSLYKRILPIKDPKTSILSILDQWAEEGNRICSEELLLLVQRMKNFKRYHQALQISQWMTDRRFLELTPEIAAGRFNLMYEIYGLERAEKYFNDTSNKLRSYKLYNAVLNCYVKEKSVEKAEAIMQEMEQFGLVTSFSYTVLVNLYARTGQHEKIDILLNEMEGKGISHNKYTLVSRMNAYVLESDIDGMKSILNQMEQDPDIFVDWTVYANAVSAYMKLGLIDEALSMLKKIEMMTSHRRNKSVLDYLVTLYASIGLKDEVYRIWDFYIAGGWVPNKCYSSMISSLMKLDDIKGAERIFKNWESTGTAYDFRVLNRLICGYCKKGLVEKAEEVAKGAVEKAAERGYGSITSTWGALAIGYLELKQMPKVVEMTKKALSVATKGWKPNPVFVDPCLDYFENQGDVDGIDEFVKQLRALGPLTREVYQKLLRVYNAEGKPIFEVLDWMKVDGISVDEESQ